LESYQNPLSRLRISVEFQLCDQKKSVSLSPHCSAREERWREEAAKQLAAPIGEE
jgi:hypothetical protein